MTPEIRELYSNTNNGSDDDNDKRGIKYIKFITNKKLQGIIMKKTIYLILKKSIYLLSVFSFWMV